MINYRIQHKYMKDMKEHVNSSSDTANHSIISGNTGRGKHVTKKMEIEVGLDSGKVKYWMVWCEDWDALREELNYLIPNMKDKEKLRKQNVNPKKYNVRVYVPISEKIPKYIQEGLIRPFTMSIDNLSPYNIYMMVGKVDDAYYREYNSFLEEGMTFTDFKTKIEEGKRGDHRIEKGFCNIKMYTPQKGNPATIDHLFRRIGEFNKEGIISNTKDKYALENQLKDEVDYQDCIVVLYTGFIKSPIIRKIVTVYFIEKLIETCREQQNNRKVEFRHEIYINELETFLSSSKDRASTPTDDVINKRMDYWGSKIRHSNIILSLDLKGITGFDRKTLQYFERRYYCGGIGDENEIEFLKGQNKIINTSNIMNASFTWKKHRDYRFLILNEKEIPIWFNRRGKKQYGYELFRPTKSKFKPVEMKQNDFRAIDGIKFGKIVSFYDIKKELGKKWNESESKLIKKREKEKKDKIDKKEESKKTPEDIRLNVIQEMLKANPNITILDLSKMLGVSDRTILRDRAILKKRGLV